MSKPLISDVSTGLGAAWPDSGASGVGVKLKWFGDALGAVDAEAIGRRGGRHAADKAGRAVTEGEEDGRGVLGAAGCSAVDALRRDLGNGAYKVDHAVDHVDAKARHAARGRLGRVDAP